MRELVRFLIGVFALIVLVKMVDSLESGCGFTVIIDGKERSFEVRPGTSHKSAPDAGSSDAGHKDGAP